MTYSNHIEHTRTRAILLRPSPSGHTWFHPSAQPRVRTHQKLHRAFGRGEGNAYGGKDGGSGHPWGGRRGQVAVVEDIGSGEGGSDIGYGDTGFIEISEGVDG